MNRFQGKVCALIAATTGIGFATAQRLAREGGKVVICSRRQDHLDTALEAMKQEGLQVDGMIADVEKDQLSFVEFVGKKYGKIDCLMNSMAVSKHIGPSLTIPESLITRTFHANVTVSHLLVRNALPYLPPQSSVLFLTSLAGFIPMKDVGIYSASKAALISLVRVLALELIDNKIRVNGLAPGLVDTRFSERFPEAVKLVPMGRGAAPEEIAGPAAFLLSSDASFITGETIVVSGGQR